MKTNARRLLPIFAFLVLFAQQGMSRALANPAASPATSTNDSPQQTSGTSAQFTVVPDDTAAQWLAEAEACKPAEIVPAGETRNSLRVTKGDVVVKGTVQGNVGVMGGHLFVLGKVQGQIIALCANVTILGEANHVMVLNGNLRVAGTIRGHAKIQGGSIEKTPKGVILDKIFPAPHSPEVDSLMKLLASFYTKVIVPYRLSIVLAFGSVSLFASILLALLVPSTLEKAAEFLPKSTFKALILGFAANIAVTLMIAISVLLCFVLVGIPLMGILFLIEIGLHYFGIAALSIFLGRFLCSRMSRAPGTVLCLVAGWIPIFLISLVPNGWVLNALFITPLSYGLSILAVARRGKSTFETQQ